MLPVPDEQKGEETRELPEDQQKQQILGKHDAEHRAHEQQQERIKAAGGILRLQVVARIQNDQEPDADYQVRKQQPEPVEAKCELQADAWKPRPAQNQRLALKRRRREVDETSESEAGDNSRRQCRVESQA